MIEGPLDTLVVLSVLEVPSQLKMLNLDCWGPGESIDTHIVERWEKVEKFEFPAKFEKGPQDPSESAEWTKTIPEVKGGH